MVINQPLSFNHRFVYSNIAYNVFYYIIYRYILGFQRDIVSKWLLEFEGFDSKIKTQTDIRIIYQFIFNSI